MASQCTPVREFLVELCLDESGGKLEGTIVIAPHLLYFSDQLITSVTFYFPFDLSHL